MDLNTLFKTEDLHMTTFPDGVSVMWRLLTTREYRIFSALRDNRIYEEDTLYEKVFEMISASPLSGVCRAGIVNSVAQLCLWMSGDCENITIKEDIEFVRSQYKSTSVSEYIKRIICIAFPSLAWKEFDSMSRKEILRLFVVSEAILKNKTGTYEDMDLRKITNGEEKKAINMEQENSAINRATGGQTLSKAQLAQLKRKR